MPTCKSDAPDLVASLLAGGFDREAARWARRARRHGRRAGRHGAGRCSRSAHPSRRAGDQRIGRIEDFADRDESEGKQRTALLVAGLAGLGRIDPATAGRLNRRLWARAWRARRAGRGLIDGAMRRRQAGTALLLTASALQGGDFDEVRAHLHVPCGQRACSRTGRAIWRG